MERTESDLQRSYDRVADEYTRRFFDELDRKPLDQMMLDRLAEMVGDRGVICDLGCGPGQIARYLHERGAQVCGIDLSAEMVAQARRLNPDIPFQQGDILALTDVRDDSYAGIAAFYSIIHVPPSSIVNALREIRRVLMPQGVLLLTFHIGQQITHLDEWWGQKVSLDFFFHETAAVADALTRAGFALEDVVERDPYPEVEVQTRRAYIVARKP